MTATKKRPEYVCQIQICSESWIWGTYVYEVGLVPQVKVVDDAGFVQMGELGHVVRPVEFGRIDLVGLLDVNFSFLYSRSVL